MTARVRLDTLLRRMGAVANVVIDAAKGAPP